MNKKYGAVQTLFSALVFFLVFAMLIGNGFCEEKVNIISQTKWLTFTPTGYSHERDLVANGIEDAIKKAEKITGKKVEIYIALEDLNEDGNDEIFAYLIHPIYCGAKGNCSLEIYTNINGKLKKIGPPIVPYIPIDEKGQQDMIGVQKNNETRWEDIIIGKSIYKWSGSKYEVVQKLEK